MTEATIATISIRNAKGKPMRAWMARPTGERPESGYPAVLIVHEIWGLVDNLKAILQRFAREGYVVLAPDLYDRPGGKAVCVTRAMVAMQRGKGVAVDDLRSAAKQLGEMADVDASRRAAAGFCMGGGFALLMALDPSTKVAAPFYGMTPAYLKAAESSCPIIASYGDKDRVFKPKAKKLKARLKQVGVPHDYKMYRNVGHSFMTKPHRGLLAKIGGFGPMNVGHDPEAAEDAWRRLLAFFEMHLAPQ